jgi:hypothetical protein
VPAFTGISKAKSESFVPEIIPSTWEASTLPLSYTRPNHAYFTPKKRACKTRVLLCQDQSIILNTHESPTINQMVIGD